MSVCFPLEIKVNRNNFLKMETILNGSTKAKKFEFQMYRKSSFYSNNNYTEDWNNRKSYVLIKAVLKQQNKFTTNVQGQIETATSVTSGQATNIFVSATAKQTNINNFHCHHSTKTPSIINNNIDEPTPSPRSQFKVINVCNNFTAQKSISKLQITNNTNDESSSYVVNNFKNPVIKVRIESEQPSSKYNINKENIKNRSQTYINNTYNMKTQKQFMEQNTIDNYSYQFERKSKKVEFCKTEVHFTAESGRINIVEIDGKPPPTKNFRRRRRHLQKNSPIYENTEQNCQLPAIEYPVAAVESNNNLTNETETTDLLLPTYQKNNNIDKDKDKYITHIDLTTPTSELTQPQIVDDETKDSSEKENTPKSILKNKPLKPLRSYHLGENLEHVESLNNSSTVNNKIEITPVSPSIELNNQLSIVRQNLNKLQNKITLHEQQMPSMKITTNDIHSKRAILKPFKSPEAVKLIRNTNRDIQQRTSSSLIVVNTSNNYKSNVGETKTTVPKIVPNITNKRLLTNDEKNFLNDRKNREDSTNSKLITKSSIDRFRIDRFRKKNDTDLTNNEKNTLRSPISAPPRTYTVINRIQLPPTTFQTLKSTSLVMNIIKNNLNNMQDFPKKSSNFHSILNNNNNSNNNNEKLLVSNQLEALKKLYENADEFSDDGEKTTDIFFANNKKTNDEINLLEKDEKCSELSGSWKKVRKIQPTAPKRKSATYTKQRGVYSVNNAKDVQSRKQPVEKPVRKQNENSRLYIKQK